jgi:glycosyltransferase involved in cell wall biosynthesis
LKTVMLDYNGLSQQQSDNHRYKDGPGEMDDVGPPQQMEECHRPRLCLTTRNGRFESFIPSAGVGVTRVSSRDVLDNIWWIEQTAQVDRADVRAAWRIPLDATVLLFCGKLQPWKRPLDIFRAFAKASVPGSCLVIAGDGPLRQTLDDEAQSLGIAEGVRFLGFVNQTQLPGVYRSSDLLVLASEYEVFSIVVNEAMLCGCPVVVSDRVGARFDLVHEGKTGFVYPAGNVEALAAILRKILPDRGGLQQMGDAARARMKDWSPRENVQGFVEAIEKAVRLRQDSTSGRLS